MAFSYTIKAYKQMAANYMNNLLSIVIPTYNRADILKENIELIFPKIKEFNLGIYISDDSNNCDTKKMIESLRVQFNYPYFFYEKNIPPLGHDANCIASLKKAKSEFVWYLGDSMIIPLDAIDEVIDIISKHENDIDFICLNSPNKHHYQSGVVLDTHNFIVNSTWHLTLSGATIYNQKVIEWMSNIDFHEHYKNFIQLGIILKYCEQENAKFYWCNDLIVMSNKNKKSYWSKNTISVFAHDWWVFVNQFNKLFSCSEKRKVAKSHSMNTHIFGLKNYFQIRANGELTLALVNKYRHELLITSRTPLFLIILIALIPIRPLSCFMSLVLKMKSIATAKPQSL